MDKKLTILQFEDSVEALHRLPFTPKFYPRKPLGRKKKSLFLILSFFLFFFLLWVIPFSKKTPLSGLIGLHLKGQRSDFVGRQRYLELLYKDLLSEKDVRTFQEGVKIKGLWGRGGYGKSELAIEFANRFLSEFSLIWTFCCDSQEQIDQSYHHLAERLQILRPGETADQIKSNVHFYLENGKFDLPWLLIFDNVENKFTDYPRHGGIVITTSQKKVLDPELLLEITPFSKEEAFLLLEKITGEKRSSAMEQLALDLEGIPLLVNYAAHYIKATPGCSVAEYQHLFSTHLLEDRGPLWNNDDVNQGYLKSLAASWQFHLHSLEKENPFALRWLFVCSYLYPEQIPEQWLDEWLEGKNSITKGEILKTLQDYGIIRYEAQSKAFSLHRFFQHMLRVHRRHEQQEDLGQALSLLVKHAADYDFSKSSSWKQGEAWYLHGSELRKWLTSVNPQLIDQTFQLQEADLYEGIGQWCAFNDRYHEALEMDTLALKPRVLFMDEKSFKVGVLYKHLGWCQFWLGHYSEAMKMCNKAEDILVSCLDGKSLDYAATLNLKGLILNELKQYREALQCHYKALEIRTENLGKVHNDVSRSLHNIAKCLDHLRHSRESLTYYKKSGKIIHQTCGKKHPFNAKNMEGRAWLLYRQKQYLQAIRLFHQALSLHTSLKGKNHGAPAYPWLAIGWCYYRLNQFKKARDVFKKSLPIGASYIGKDSPLIMRAYKGIGWSYLKEKKVNRGLKYLLQQLHMGANLFQGTIGIYHLLENFQSALKEASKVVEKQKKNDQKIKEAAKAAWEISIKELGNDHPLSLFFLTCSVGS